MKQIKFLSLISIVLLISSCGGDNKSGSSSDLRKAPNGDVYYGGVFRFNEVEYYRSLYPQNVTEVTSHRITNQVYEGLTRFNQRDLSVMPCLAESWEVDSTATFYTFHLRKGIMFHDDECFPNGKGRELKAGDVEYCLNKLCTPDPNNQGYWIFKDRVKGSDAHYFSREYKGLKEAISSASGDDLEGIKARIAELEESYGDDIQSVQEKVEGINVIDDYTITIELERPFSGFVQMLALPFTAVFPKEAFEKYGTELRNDCVGTGPFMLKSVEADQAVFLERNPNYWDKDEWGNQLPYLDGIKISFIKDDKTELLEFQKGKLEFKYRLPLEMIPDIMDESGNLKGDYTKFVLQTGPELSLQYYGFLNADPEKVFSKKEVRLAFCYAIDRESIVKYTLKGAGYPATHGIVPLGMPGYNYESIAGFNYDVSKAQQLLSQAGYPGGKGFPELTLQINSGGGRNEQVAEAIQKMLQDNLSINVNITKLPFAQHLENVETGKVKFWRSGWIADYPDPENFLNLFFSAHIPAKLSDKSYINSTRFRDSRFDELFRKALQTTDTEERTRLYEDCDKILLEGASCLPIYYDKSQRLIQPYVRNFDLNGMEYRLMRDTYFVPMEQ